MELQRPEHFRSHDNCILTFFSTGTHL